MTEVDKDIVDPYDAIIVRRMQQVVEYIVAPLDRAQAVAMAGLERGGEALFDQEQFSETLRALSQTRRVLDLAIAALVQMRKQLDCDHDWQEHHLSIHVGTQECRKCDLAVQTRYRPAR